MLTVPNCPSTTFTTTPPNLLGGEPPIIETPCLLDKAHSETKENYFSLNVDIFGQAMRTLFSNKYFYA